MAWGTKRALLYALSVCLSPFLSEAATEPVALQLKWKHQFQFAGYYMALEKGFYRDAGFDVNIREARINASTIGELVNGNAN
ncbi:MAG: ABC transporter substrate-binding protein, partial [Mariprofundaceae bacterium]|nr:ABC transporter substrate-binding protein [Mariprofundaceae bacterium]